MFSSQQEAEALYSALDNQDRAMFHVKRDGSQVFIEGADFGFTLSTRERLSHHLTRFIINYYEDQWFIDILSNQFYYKDPDEQASILDIIHSILNGEKQDLPNLEQLPERELIIQTSIQDLLKTPTNFSFESIETFRLHRYRNWLLTMTELALDEYKLQQEYSAFIEKLRTIVRAYRPLHQKVYVLDQDPFKLYNDRLETIDNVQSVRSFYPILKQWGIEAKPSIILSLIGLSPAEVHIYTSRQGQDEMITLLKVFEERVVFHPIEEADSIRFKKKTEA